MLKSIVIGIFIMNFALLLVQGDPIEAGVSSEYESDYFLKEPECQDKTDILCKKVENYPSDKIMPHLMNYNKMEVPNYYGEKDYKDNICQTEIEDVMPQAGRNSKDVYTYIINIENVYTQVVRRETCLGENSTCNNVVSAKGYKSYCQQTYTYQSLLAIDSFFQISTDYFKIPSGCCCTIVLL